MSHILQGPTHGIALPICLALIVLPPLIAAIITGLASFFRRFGSALGRLCNLLGLALSYAAQAAMVIASIACTYYSIGASTIHIDLSIPGNVSYLLCCIMTLASILGFVVLTIFGLYVFEWIITSSVTKRPTELALVKHLVEYSGRVAGGFCGMLKHKSTRAHGELPGDGTQEAGHAVSISSQRGENQPLQSDDSDDSRYDDDKVSDDEPSAVDVDGLSDMGQWK